MKKAPHFQSKFEAAVAVALPTALFGLGMFAMIAPFDFELKYAWGKVVLPALGILMMLASFWYYHILKKWGYWDALVVHSQQLQKSESDQLENK
jgi:Flp pilus assembly protein TadB